MTTKKKNSPKAASGAKQSPDLAAQLLDAHVQFEMRRFTPKGIEKTVREEVEAAFQWLEGIRLKELASADRVLGVIKRNVVELPVAGGLTELIGEMSRMVIASKHSAETTLDEIIPRKSFDAIVDKASSLDRVRMAAIKRTVRNPAYSRLIADAIYTVAKEFVLQQNLFVQKMPGLSSLIKMGQGAVRMAAPSLEPAIDAQIKERIEAQVETAIHDSEEFLMGFLDGDRIAGISDGTWNHIAGLTLEEHYSNIDADDMEDFIVIGYEFWMEFRKTEYFKKTYTELVHYFFEKYGDKEMDVLLEDVGVTSDMVILEIVEFLAPILAKAKASGYLEKRIRQRLQSFYQSKAAKDLLG
ncbi:hypothetical protein SAMN02745216_01471 [Desulfatibacillum alkenivorans DSM 16219]|jgi:hypothetical protein|uniref:Uncharacterized protein n=1 Tax=Desulfatibacillum alkenivorans DSM 16219 TaxID=1121393 RepID=A0A1M6IG97_9BACT|nr:hypothetical protein [Desulfatibacillum alkenivorans]SHJ33482.1 hypothetical protein SAMN02745216_01471 [Desulfatibacillum alkenivorans DSM 16219]